MKDKNIEKQLKSKTKTEIIDFLLNSFEKNNLVNPKYRAWFAKRFYKLDVTKILKLSEQALVKGDNKTAYFCHMIKAEYEEL